MKYLVTLAILMFSIAAVAAAPSPIGVAASDGNGMTVQMSDGSTYSLPSNADLAQAVGLEGPAAEIFTVPAGDESLDYLIKIFGTELFGLGEGTPSIVQGISGIWSIGVMIVGVLFLAYILFAGVLKTAHEGEVLGRQWSSIWIPIRAAGGFAMILPIAGGYCMAQVLVAWLTTVGIGLADGLWATVGIELQATHGAVIRPEYPDAKNNVEKILAYQVCNQSMQKSAGAGNYIASVQFRKGLISDSLVFGNQTGVGYAQDACGGFSWDVIDKVSTATGAISSEGGVVAENMGKLGAALGENKEMTKAIFDAQRAAIIATAMYLEPFAKHIVDNKTIPDAEFIDAAEAVYNRSMSLMYARVTAPHLDKKIFEMNADMLRDGWLFAGAYFMRFVNLNNELRDLAHAQPSDIATNSVSIDAIVAEPVSEDLNILAEYFQAREYWRGNAGVAEGFKREVGLDSGNIFDQALARIMHGGLLAQDEFVKMMAANDKHPIIALQNFGNYMIGAYEAAKVVEFGLTKVVPAGKMAAIFDSKGSNASSAGKNQAMNAAADTAKGTMDWLFNMLLVAALILAIAVPLLPYIIWCIDVLGWLMAVVVSVIAAPVWMVMHMHPEGHEVAGYGAQGYMLLLSVVLKPALMVMSLIFAMLLSWASISITAKGWAFAFASANSSVIVGPVIAIGGMVVFSMVMLLLVYKTFALIHGIQNEVLSWVGGRDQDLVGAGRSSEVLAGMIAAGAMRTGGLASKIGESRAKREARESRDSAKHSAAADNHETNAMH